MGVGSGSATGDAVDGSGFGVGAALGASASLARRVRSTDGE